MFFFQSHMFSGRSFFVTFVSPFLFVQLFFFSCCLLFFSVCCCYVCRTNEKVEIVFPVASEAMTATGEEAGEGSMQVVPGVSGEFSLGLHYYGGL